MSESILSVDRLSVEIPTSEGLLRPVQEIKFDLTADETLCIVGESGCGKSLTSLAIMDLLPSKARRTAHKLIFDGDDLQNVSEARMTDIRGNKISMIFQEPMTSLNPAYTIGNQLIEVHQRHLRSKKSVARDRAIYLLEKVGITAAASRMSQYPHQLSGGLRQRVMIAMALMCGPKLLIADEPTTALDVTIQAQILHLLRDLQREFRMGIILITHDLGIVARVADKVAVMYAGQIIETGTAAQVFGRPSHPYTQGLLECIPIPGKTKRGDHLGSIPGIVPSMLNEIPGCHFQDRCRYLTESCKSGEIPENFVGVKEHTYRCVLPENEILAHFHERQGA